MSVSESVLLSVARVDLITRTVVGGVLYGFMFPLYITCARALYCQRKDQHRGRQNFFNLFYMSLIMACGLFTLSVDARNMQSSYVDHADFPGGGFVYSILIFGRLPISVIEYVINILLDILTGGVQIWRLWVIWRSCQYCPYIVVLPIMALLAYAAIEICDIVEVVRPMGLVDVSFVWGSKGLFLFATVFVTLLITAKIAVVRREHIKLMGKSDIARQYTSIISMLVESYALESLWVTLSIALNTNVPDTEDRTRAVGDFFSSTRRFIQILAYLLVMYRVSTGQSWNNNTGQEISSLQWNRDIPQTTQLATCAPHPMPQEEV